MDRRQMFRLIRKLLRSAPAPRISHPIFGELVLNQGAKGPYWLHEVFDDAEVTISIDTHDGEPPTDWQVNFFQEITRDEQSTYERVRVRLSVEHERMHGESVRPDWRQTFRLAGIGVPLDGWELNPWDITDKCRTDRSGYLYTCHFEYGLLRDVSIGT